MDMTELLSRRPLADRNNLCEYANESSKTNRKNESSRPNFGGEEEKKDLTSRIQEIFMLHASNEIIQYTDTLSKQIPPSRAAHAYNNFTHAMISYEFIKLCGLWDRPSDNSNSIPDIAALLDDQKVQEYIIEENVEYFQRLNERYEASLDPSIELIPILEVSASAAISSSDIQNCLAQIREIKRSKGLERVTNHRDRLSHSFEKTRREIQNSIDPAKYGDESWLLEKSIYLIQKLYSMVNGTSFDIEVELKGDLRKSAEDLWTNTKFAFPEGRNL